MLPKIYLCAYPTRAIGNSFIGYAIAEDGEGLCSHLSSSLSFSKLDMGYTSKSKHDLYKKKYPDGYILVWINNPNDSEELTKVLKLNQEKHAEEWNMINILPNKSSECYILDRDNPLDYMYLKIIMNEARGKDSVDAAFDFRDMGYTYISYNKRSNTYIDKYITRLQKKFENLCVGYVYYKIYYGQIGRNNDYGYYIYRHEKKKP